jgi:hypothetical protein
MGAGGGQDDMMGVGCWRGYRMGSGLLAVSLLDDKLSAGCECVEQHVNTVAMDIRVGLL